MERQEKRREASSVPAQPIEPESSQSSSAKKRELTEVELELEVDEEEPSANHDSSEHGTQLKNSGTWDYFRAALRTNNVFKTKMNLF